MVLAVSVSVGAQAPSAASGSAAASGAPIEEVVVTASRLTTAGFNAPTPTEVLGTQELQQLAEPNIVNSVAQLPALSGNLGTTVGNGGTSAGTNGLSELNLRALGTVRTLVLMDGQRIAPAFIDGTVDVSLVPQLLIQRVDVVTGGVSASYGSDAVAGVVNFVTDTRLSGFKANLQGGITNYDDDRSGLVQLAWGGAALDDRFHIQLAGEYFDNQGVPARYPGDNHGSDGRTWYNTPVVVTRTAAQTPAGQPEYNLFTNTQFTTYSAYGLITSGPLKGTAFGPGGTTYPFQYGSSCIGSNCIGGDLSGNYQGTNTIDSPLRRGTLYARLGYDLAPNMELYATASYAGVRTSDQPNAGAPQQNNLVIQCSNPFVPQAVQAACAANHITTLGNSTSGGFGVTNIIFPNYIDIETNRTQPRYVLGLDAKDLNFFGKPWSLQSYLEFGETNEHINIHNMMLLPRYNAAINATLLPSGQIACSSALAQANGCIPLDVIGLNPVNPAAWAYIAPANGPFDYTLQKEEAASIALSGAPLQDWAGPVSMAVGAEWRQESYAANADWNGAGISDQSPVTASYPADPVLSATGNNWYAGNFHDGTGLYNVREAFAEMGLPLFDNHAVGKFDANFAGRETHYSTAGSVFTWKYGGVWDTPLDGVRLRAVRSQDIRAPNLQDLYAPELVQSNAGIVNRLTNQTVTVAAETIGNPALKPEIAQNLEAGLVFQPNWLRGLRASFDYFHIKVTGAVETLTTQQMVDLCQIAGNAAACNNVSFSSSGGAGLTNSVILQPFNAATITTSGFDIAASFPIDLGRSGALGTLTLTGQATHVQQFTEDTGLPGQPIIYAAGADTNIFGGYTSGSFGIAPHWKGLVTEAWNLKPMGLTLIERIVSSGYINPSYVGCDAGSCPTPTVQNPTINTNHIAGAMYLDVAGSYSFNDARGQIYFKIDNALNHNPPTYGSPGLFDWLGRVYRVGVRLNLD
jgi:outer membrane receptor protein involved in Fe transport